MCGVSMFNGLVHLKLLPLVTVSITVDQQPSVPADVTGGHACHYRGEGGAQVDP